MAMHSQSLQIATRGPRVLAQDEHSINPFDYKLVSSKHQKDDGPSVLSTKSLSVWLLIYSDLFEVSVYAKV